MLKNIKKRFAFTTAEVLMVLGVIGVVAVLTIPNFMKESQNKDLAARAKKAYLDFNQAIEQLTTDYESVGDLEGTGLFASTVSLSTLGDAFVKYFNVTQNCKMTGLANGACMANPQNQDKDGSSIGNSGNWNSTIYYTFVTTGGVAYALGNATNKADGSGGTACGNTTDGVNHMTRFCGYVRLDVNGPAGPNRMGRDAFVFYISSGNGAILYPAGGSEVPSAWWNGSTKACQKGVAETNSLKCAGRLMEEGWEMNY